MNLEQNQNEEAKRQNGDEAGVAEGHMAQAASAALPGQKWYKCSFCEGGFSCAQALGGHMNVHRRERALQSRSSPAPCDRRPATSSLPSSLPSPFDHQPALSSLHPKLCTEKYVWEKDADEILMKDCSELSLEKPEMNSINEDMGSSHSDEDVDLELRLGQKPHKKMRLSLPFFTIL